MESGYKLFASRVNAMCLKKYYNSIPNYLALVVAILGLFLMWTTTKLAVSSDKGQSWQELEDINQALHDLHIHFFIDTEGEGESISMLTNISKNMMEVVGGGGSSLQAICEGCIATKQNYTELFKSMPYDVQKPISMQYMIKDIYKTKNKLLSFTYGLSHLPEKFQKTNGSVRTNKTLTVYYNTDTFHFSFMSLNFGHNLALL